MAITMREHEEWLDALLNSLDLAESDADREEILSRVTEAIDAAVEKRDRVFRFLQHCEQKVSLAKAEIDRLRAFAASYEKLAERVSRYVVDTILSLGADERGKYRKLEGTLCVFAVAKNPESVEITDVDAIPDEYKVVS